MRRAVVILIILGFCLCWVVPVLAHRPYFEHNDIGPDAPWLVDEPTVSTAIYATLGSAMDVDYFAFDGQAGQVILLALTIPQIEGQEDFAPTMALMGPGLPDGDVPARVVRPVGAGAIEIPSPPGPAPTFFEPFSRTSYWDRQEERVNLPSDGCYLVAVWHPEGWPGRYVFVIGDQERLGGDPAFPIKMRQYWRPVGSSAVKTPLGGLGLVLWTAFALLLGAMPFARWLGRLLPYSDIRQDGDSTLDVVDAWRPGRWRVEAPIALLDYLKGIVPVVLARAGAGISGWGLVSIGLAPVFGHAISPFLRSRRGRMAPVTLGIWTALALWEGPAVLGVSLAVLSLFQTVDAWSLTLSMLALAALLLMRGAGAAILVVWVGNVAILLWRQWPDLRQGMRLRPWLLHLLGRSH